jgi:hypothetical protein
MTTSKIAGYVIADKSMYLANAAKSSGTGVGRIAGANTSGSSKLA